MLIFQPAFGPIQATLSLPEGSHFGSWGGSFGSIPNLYEGVLPGDVDLAISASTFSASFSPEFFLTYDLDYSSPLIGNFSITIGDVDTSFGGFSDASGLWTIGYNTMYECTGRGSGDFPWAEGCYSQGIWAEAFPANEPGFALIGLVALAGLWCIRYTRRNVHTSFQPADDSPLTS